VKRNWEDPQAAAKTTIRCEGDGVYCLQYDEEKIVSGNRANKVKVWRCGIVAPALNDAHTNTPCPRIQLDLQLEDEKV
jgi:hypothetical protein